MNIEITKNVPSDTIALESLGDSYASPQLFYIVNSKSFADKLMMKTFDSCGADDGEFVHLNTGNTYHHADIDDYVGEGVLVKVVTSNFVLKGEL